MGVARQQVRLIRQRDVCRYEDGPRDLPSRELPPGAAQLASRMTVLGCAPGAGQVLALTYDDGPDPVQTPAILDALDAAGAKATFFVLLTQARAHPHIVRETVARGHDVGLHGGDHTRLSTLGVREGARRVREAVRELEGITGTPVRLYRPAYGALTPPQLLAIRLAGLEVVLWSCWVRDWETASVEEFTERAVRFAHPGGIMLLHDASEGPAHTALPADFDRGAITRSFATRLVGEGYELTSVSGLLRRAPQGRMRWGESRERARAAVAETAAAIAHGEASSPVGPNPAPTT